MSDHLREFRVHSRSKLRTTAREISRRERGEGGREGSPRRDHLWFGRWDSGNSTHSRTEEDRWKLAWLGRTDGRTSERMERRTLKREKTTSECDRDMAGAEEWGGRETRSERERERESQADGDRGMGWVRGIE